MQSLTTIPGDLETINEAAERYHINPRTVRKWISQGIVTGYRLPGGRIIRVSRTEVDSKVRPIPTVGPDAA